MKFIISDTPVQKKPVFRKFSLKDLAVGTVFRYSDSSKYDPSSCGCDPSTYIKLPSHSSDGLYKMHDLDDEYWPVLKIDKSGIIDVSLFHNKNKWYFFEVEVSGRHISPYPIHTEF